MRQPPATDRRSAVWATCAVGIGNEGVRTKPAVPRSRRPAPARPDSSEWFPGENPAFPPASAAITEIAASVATFRANDCNTLRTSAGVAADSVHPPDVGTTDLLHIVADEPLGIVRPGAEYAEPAAPADEIDQIRDRRPRCCDGTGSERRMAPSDISPVECPDSNSDIGRIRSRVTRPAPVCRVVLSGGTAEPVRMKRPAPPPMSIARRTWFQMDGTVCHSSSRRGGPVLRERGTDPAPRRAAGRYPCRAEPRSPRVAFRWQSSRRLGGPRTAPRRPIRVWRRGPRQRYADGIARPTKSPGLPGPTPFEARQPVFCEVFNRDFAIQSDRLPEGRSSAPRFAAVLRRLTISHALPAIAPSR